MKHVSFLLIIAFVLLSCSKDESPTSPANEIRSWYTVKDTNGVSKTVFHTGEYFDVVLNVQNNYPFKISYYAIGEPPYLEIWKGDTLIVYSDEGLSFESDIIGDISNYKAYLNPGEIYDIRWHAPYSPGTLTQTTLSPGEYQIRVNYTWYFNEVKLPPIKPIAFTIVP